MSCTSKKKYSGAAVVLENKLVAEDTFHLILKIAGALAPASLAGQFVMLRLPNRSDPLLGRPLAIYRCKRIDDWTQLEVVYLVVGKGTKALSEIRSGDHLELTGPLGNDFNIDQTVHNIFVAGGIGQTPFLQLAENIGKQTRCTLLYGVRSKTRFALVEHFEDTGIEVLLATDDGSAGHHGSAVDLIRQVVKPNEPARLLCCGPKPMLRAAFEVAKELGLPCDVSLESPMACGLGICFGCVVPVRGQDGTIDYQRICEAGPAFDGYSIDWNSFLSSSSAVSSSSGSSS
ncbi:MAG: dihydroorotate dehydrogenase electron transfer subunit [Planctomycetaceae bacterium]|nr:dihydroorotate dehydrogenase electron transfer subunit [Planctomycetaceae bacterium]